MVRKSNTILLSAANDFKGLDKLAANDLKGFYKLGRFSAILNKGDNL